MSKLPTGAEQSKALVSKEPQIQAPFPVRSMDNLRKPLDQWVIQVAPYLDHLHTIGYDER